MKKILFLLILFSQFGCQDTDNSDPENQKKEHCVIITFKQGFKDTLIYKSVYDDLILYDGDLFPGSTWNYAIANGVATFKQQW